MAMRKRPSRFRAIRPAAEDLEGRRLLSGTVSGVNTEGDHWNLTLYGPGVVRVTKQPDARGNATALTARSEISTITIAGTNPLSTRLVGTIVPSGTGTGHVFFQTLNEVRNIRETNGNSAGLLAIDMPNFYLGLTASAAPAASATGTGIEPSIAVPDGVGTLRFGGVDTTAFFGASTASTLQNNGRNNEFTVALGLPQFSGGTRIVTDTITTDSNNYVPTGGTATTASTFQNGVAFSVVGRISLFQANQINGSTTNAPSFFPSGGGTIVVSTQSSDQTVPGQIGFVKVGGNATNFNVAAFDKIRQVFVGGETNNVGILAPGGVRYAQFGKGFDNSEILAHTIQTFAANRDVTNSRVITDRQIDNIEIGGDVIGSTFEAGYGQALSGVFSSFLTGTVSIPNSTAQIGGRMRVNVAGNISNSVFAASTIPDAATNQFGTPNDLKLPGSLIKARVEGSINNTTITPQSPRAAFYAGQVFLTSGPVVPPSIPEAPYTGALTPTTLPGIRNPYAYAGIKRR